MAQTAMVTLAVVVIAARRREPFEARDLAATGGLVVARGLGERSAGLSVLVHDEVALSLRWWSGSCCGETSRASVWAAPKGLLPRQAVHGLAETTRDVLAATVAASFPAAYAWAAGHCRSAEAETHVTAGPTCHGPVRDRNCA
jgi:hypothetical protein